ncbi:hypothetical protein ABT340_36780 [Streptosporangium sp. NPDC000239]|uniref:hypothetical protein n=1 Tax=Streptosporangium sp. NPDC000239 TaxID=3154248 RepID=UPI0033314BCE
MRTYGHRVLFIPAFVVLLATVLVVGQRPALADGAPTGQDVHVAQTLGTRELSVILRRVDEVPGPLRVEVLTHAGATSGTLAETSGSPAGTASATGSGAVSGFGSGGGGGRLTLRLVPTGASGADDGLPAAGTVVSQAELVLGATPGVYGTTLRVDRPGPWELTVDDGRDSGRIPFVVPAPVSSPPDTVAYAGFSVAGGLLLLALGTAVWSRRWWLPLVPACGMVAALATGVTGAALSPLTPQPPLPGQQVDATVDNVVSPYTAARPVNADYSRPPVNMLVRASETTSGRLADLDLLLTDGSTGRPVEDLLVHDDALVHLLVVSPSGRLWHLHPVMAGPGRYRVGLALAEPGHYAISAELARRGGGVQLVRSASGLDVAPGATPVAAAPQPEGPGPREIDGVRVDLAVTAPSAGAATTVTVKLGERADLQPWLGMVGHLIVVGPLPDSTPVGAAAQTAPVWGHVHAMAPRPRGAASRPDETVAMFGPEVRFTHTFPEPGRYRLWAQVERGYALVTVPAVLDVTAKEGDS